MRRLTPARWLAAAAAVLLLLGGFGLTTASRALATADARLGADVIVTPPGELPTLDGGILLVDKPHNGALPRALVGQIAALPGVAGAIPLYNLGKLSAQECPA